MAASRKQGSHLHLCASNGTARPFAPYMSLHVTTLYPIDIHNSLPSTHLLDHTLKDLLSAKLKLVKCRLRHPDCDLLVTGSQSRIRLFSELPERHANLMAVFDLGLMILVVELRYSTSARSAVDNVLS